MAFLRSKQRPLSLQSLWFVLLTAAATVILLADAVEEIPLPHVDIYMFCSNDIKETGFDYVLELDGYFTDLLPSAVDVRIESGTQEFLECVGNENRTQVLIHSDGVAEFSDESPWTQTEIHDLVTQESLKKYFSNVCKELELFEALVTTANTEPALGPDASLNHFFCAVGGEEAVQLAAETAAVVLIVVSVFSVLCLLACCCIICGFCL